MTLTSTDDRRGQLRGSGSPAASTPQNLMVFVLSMALFGLSNILLEVIPDITIGPVDFSVSYFVFVPITLAALVSPFWVALGAPLGEIVFTDLLMGDFSGLAEVEGFIQMFLAVYIAGSVIRNPLSKLQVSIGALLVVIIDKFLSTVVDLAKVVVGVEEAEYVKGLPESMLLLEGIGFVVDILMSGVLFGIIPALWLVPALYGRIEPMLGLQPREPGRRVPGSAPKSAWFILVAALAAIVSFFFAFFEAWDIEIGAVDGDFREQFGNGFLWISVAAVIVVLALAAALFVGWRRKKRNAR